MHQGKFWLAAALGVGLQLGLAAPTMAVDGVKSVEQLLRKLSHTLQEESYRGLFTYEHGGTLDTLEIVHLVRNGVEHERLQHLSGPSREVFREGRNINCVTAAAQLLRGGLSMTEGKDLQLHEYYTLDLGGEERVAGRAARVVQLIPRDQYRYGLTFAIDQASGFPMKTLVINEQGKVLERIQFVELDMSVSEITASAEPTDGGYRLALHQGTASGCGDDAVSQDVTSATAGSNSEEAISNPETASKSEPFSNNAFPTTQWQAGWLPDGFILTGRSYAATDGHQLTYTDGLASFSVFMTPAESNPHPKPGLAQRGATVALMIDRQFDRLAATVTVVGEVPPVTAEQVARGMELVVAEDAP